MRRRIVQDQACRVRGSSSPPWGRAYYFLSRKCAKRAAGLSMARLCRSVPAFRAAWGTSAMTTVFAAGGYRAIPAVFQYSGGVAAEPGFSIVRMRFQRPLPLAQGFARIERLIGE